MNASWYDVLDVEPAATSDEVRAAWRSSVAELDPTDRRFRVFSQAAEVLLDPARRAAYDAELAGSISADEVPEPVEQVEQVELAEQVEPVPTGRRRLPLVPGWALVALAGLVAAALVVAGVLASKPSDAAVEGDTQAAQAAAERAIVPLLSYDAHHLDQSESAAEPYLTSGYEQQYQKLFAVIRQNAPRTGTVVKARYVASGVVRSGTDRVDVLVFVDQVTRNKQHPKVPVVYKNQVTVTMTRVGGQWLVDDLSTNLQS
ncbi:MAG TPA: DnaJ domain-containing protein [Nocardioides sp.]|jgi:Mce-associated membrane protein|uniref:J domain-containing protein n=1 Tax=Nocardioides sp. TaxID=35761 RepID=UPI002E36A432|nr:DnaJ domain-containing protein [Nocardioides sp.]HEX3932426.1 DnaJ domain-containing protein [Nocardioides sp.]